MAAVPVWGLGFRTWIRLDVATRCLGNRPLDAGVETDNVSPCDTVGGADRRNKDGRRRESHPDIYLYDFPYGG